MAAGKHSDSRCGSGRVTAQRPLLSTLLLLILLALTGCGSERSDAAAGEFPSGGELRLAYTPHEEDIAVASLTAVVLEGYADYDVTLTETSPEEAVKGVAGGEYDAYQGIWVPAQEDLIESAGKDVDLLNDWLVGTTRAGLAAPSYLGIREMNEVGRAGAERALVLEPEASALGAVPESVFEEYGLEPEYFPDMESVRRAAEPLYEREEPFVLYAYSPGWINDEYELVYLEGADSLRRFNEPYDIAAVARPGLRSDDAFAYEMLDELQLTESQIESLETSIRDAEDPQRGALDWAEENRTLLSSWVYMARQNAR